MVLDDGLGIEKEYFVEQRHIHMVQKFENSQNYFLLGVWGEKGGG